MRTDLRFNIFVCVFLLVFNALLLFIWHDAQAKPELGDAYIYSLATEHPGADIPSPFMFRQMSPRIVYIADNTLHWGKTFGWAMLTYGALTITQILFFFMMRITVGLNRFTAFIGTLFLTCTYWFTLFNYQDVWLVEPLNSLFTTAALWALLSRRYVWFIVTVVVGSLNKEAVLLLLPLYPILLLNDGKKLRSKEVVISLLTVVAVGGLYALYRKGILTSINSTRTINPLLGPFGSPLENVHSAAYPRRGFYEDVFSIYYFVWVAVLYGWYKLSQSKKGQSRLSIIGIYWLLVVTVISFLVTDMPRMYAWAAPIIILSYAVVVNHAKEKDRIWVLLSLLLYAAMNFTWILPPQATEFSLLALAVMLPIINSRPVDAVRQTALYG